MHNNLLKKLGITICILVSFSILISCNTTKAAYMDKETNGNKKEKQILEKLDIIKKIFPSQIDKEALYATIIHRASMTSYVADAYDPNFDKNNFKKQIEKINDTKNTLKNNEGNKYAQSGNSVDLLLAATIIMLDSSGWVGQYSDDNYKKALASDRLVGNMVSDNDIIGNAVADGFNAIFCAGGALADSAATPIQFGNDLIQGQADTFIQRKSSRYYTMDRVCRNGYIGGIYSHVQNMSDANQKQLAKDKTAEEIIKLAETFRTGDTCLTGGSTQTGDLESIDAKACGEKFGPLAQKEYSRSGVFASVTLAQAWLESNCGKATPPNSNNLFGIKCSSNWSGECSNAATSEYGSGGYYSITSGFRKYPSVEESIADHSKFLTENSRYSEHGVFTATNYSEQIRAIHNAGYATDPNYSSKIIGIIQANGYDKWDVLTNTTSSSSICSPVGLNGWTIRTIAPTATDSAFNYVNSNRGQCVWYAQGRAIEIVEELGKNGKLSETEVDNIRNKLLRPYGNGGDIYDNAIGVFNGSSDIREPKAGSYIVWKQPGRYGHVAVVEDVNKIDNTITITGGWANGGSSCPNDWSCISFQNKTLDLDEFYNGYGQHYIGGYNFSGYIYFLEPKS